jgi:microcystin-dependent protein
MSEPYVGQIEFFGFDYAPVGWVMCQGQLLPINQYQALFSLLGTTYGGNGTTNFQLPDLRSRVPIAQGASSQGQSWVLGEIQGEENHRILITELPIHTHALNAVASQTSTNNIDAPGPTAVLGQGFSNSGGTIAAASIYAADTAPSQNMSAQSLAITGGGQPHSNLMPGLALNACIAISGLFPSRN